MTFPWDELNVIETKIRAAEITDSGVNTAEKSGESTTGTVKKYDPEKCIDIVYEFLEMSWAMGVENVNENLSTSFSPQSAENSTEMRREINRKIAGEDFTDRLRKHAENGDFDAIIRVAETESHRLLNTAAYSTAKKAGAKYKTWVTMNDDRVREAHQPLHAMTIGIDDYFVTFDGDRALLPGGFEKPENIVNCRCILTFA